MFLHVMFYYCEGEEAKAGKFKMSKMLIHLFGVLWLCCWLMLTGEAQIVDELKYKDPNQPISVRVKDLLSRMTLEEKIGQMTQIDRSVANATVMKTYFIGKRTKNSILPS
jgi:beta-glucosidase